MKYIVVIGDGMADNPVPELEGKTPLQHANIPVLDALAKKGEMGSVKTCPEGFPPGSDIGILAICGVDPRVNYTGRSPLEAAATGIQLAEGEASYRCNMVTYEDGDMPFEEKKILSHSGGSIEAEESIELVKDLFANPTFKEQADKAGVRVYPAPSFRHIAVQKDADLEGIVMLAPHDHLGEVIKDLLPTGNDNATVLGSLMKTANEVLDQHPINQKRREEGKLPANGVWFWAEGSAIILNSFEETYKKTGTMISAVPLCHGIANLLGLSVTIVEGATGELDTNYEGKVEAALNALKGGDDFTIIHIEAPDECTHNGDLEGKIQSIEWLDSRVLKPVVEQMDASGEDYRLIVLADHKTLTSTRGHDGEPVPYLLYDSRKNTESKLSYSEEDGAKGPYYDDGANTIIRLLFEQ